MFTWLGFWIACEVTKSSSHTINHINDRWIKIKGSKCQYRFWF